MVFFDKIRGFILGSPEKLLLTYDIIRTITIQIIVQLLFSVNDKSVSFLSTVFLQTTFYLCVGVIFFWMAVYKLFVNYDNSFNLFNK